jgi:hypothetical protein
MTLHRISVNFTPEKLELLRVRAEANNRSLNREIQHLVDAGIEKTDRQQPLILEVGKLPRSKISKILGIIGD